jgi:DNA-binding transcriptional ArsR family regulator
VAITLSSNPRTGIEFVTSVSLDLLNALYFTALADGHEGLDDWPRDTRARMDAGLRAELDLLFSFPHGEPGVMGALNDLVFLHREAWGGVDDLLRFVRDLPAAGSGDPAQPGIQGLALYALRWPCDAPFDTPAGVTGRGAIEAALRDHTDMPQHSDLAGLVAMFDDPERTRARILTLMRRFYDEHYRPDERRRIACMERSVASHRGDVARDPAELSRRLTGRNVSCLETVCEGDHAEQIFVPSVDVGPYNSCINLPNLHALYYPCEARFRDVSGDPDETTHRVALVCKALGDEQRLRMLAMLRDGELYVQEIVDRTGLHQSVVSRHLGFMRAVGLVNSRRQNNMKFYSLNQDMGTELRRALDAFMPSAAGPARPGKEARRVAPASVRQ